MDSLDAAHAKDYADKNRMSDLRRAISDFLDSPPSRCSPRTEDALDRAVALLNQDEAQIVWAWD